MNYHRFTKRNTGGGKPFEEKTRRYKMRLQPMRKGKLFPRNCGNALHGENYKEGWSKILEER